MSYTVVLTDRAKQDLRAIALWLAEEAKDINVAKRFVSELRTACLKLAMFPNRGAWPQDRILKSLGYRFIVHKDYLIFYLVEEEKCIVNVMAIFNGKKDYLRVMRKFV